MDKDLIAKVFLVHKGKIIGMSIGLLIGIMVLTIGFWRSAFLFLTIGLGYWIGGMSDKREKFFNLLDKILPKGLN